MNRPESPSDPGRFIRYGASTSWARTLGLPYAPPFSAWRRRISLVGPSSSWARAPRRARPVDRRSGTRPCPPRTLRLRCNSAQCFSFDGLSWDQQSARSTCRSDCPATSCDKTVSRSSTGSPPRPLEFRQGIGHLGEQQPRKRRPGRGRLSGPAGTSAAPTPCGCGARPGAATVEGLSSCTAMPMDRLPAPGGREVKPVDKRSCTGRSS